MDCTNESTEECETKDGGKRLIGTIDPDYVSPPDSKKIKLLQAKGEEEFYGRVVKVVEQQFHEAINEKNTEIEEIDEKILKVQQCLHTLRYCVSLNFYAFGKLKGKSIKDPEKNPQVNHPTVQNILGNPSSSNESVPTAVSLSAPSNKNKTKVEQTSASNAVNSSGTENKSCDSRVKDPGKPPVTQNHQESYEVISQGRQGRLQKKVRLVIGNTYQYIPDSDGSSDNLKFKWRTYIRGAEAKDVSQFISSVKFTLDKSYSPHDVITIREPPFSLSRRGWGEFKIYIELSFSDPRNKPIQLLHPLTLARTNDPLAFTGIWRLGKETWYDIWLYDKTEDLSSSSEHLTKSLDTKKPIENEPEITGLRTETVYSDSEGNVTRLHTSDEDNNGIGVVEEEVCTTVPKVESNFIENGLENGIKLDNSSDELNASCQLDQETSLSKTRNESLENNPLNDDESKTETAFFNGDLPANLNGVKSDETIQNSNIKLPQLTKDNKGDEKLFKILIRQTDGSLLSLMVPKSMYNMALKFSSKNKSATSNDTSASLKSPDPIIKKSVCETSSTNGVGSSPGKKNGFIKPQHQVYNTFGQPLLKLKPGQPANVPRIPVMPTGQGTFVRLNSIQSPASSNPQPISDGTVPIRPAIKVQDNVTKLNLTNQNFGKNLGSNRGVVKSPNSIRFAMTNMPVNNSKIIRTTLLNEKILNLKSVKSPFISSSGESIKLTPKSSTNPLLSGTIKVNTNKGIRSVSATNVSVLPASSTTNVLKSSISPSSLSPKESGGSLLSNGDVSPGKITTRRIFISAPPHLVKLREAAVQKEDGQLIKSEAIPRVKLKLGIKKVSIDEENELTTLKKFEELKKQLRTQCSQFISVDGILRLYLKALPLFLTEESKKLEFPFCAPSYEHFQTYLVGKRRAIEFWRARVIRKELGILKPPNWQRWSTVRIASWARLHGYTPVSHPSHLSVLEKRIQQRNTSLATTTLSALRVSENERVLNGDDQTLKANLEPDDSVIVVDSEEQETKPKGKKTSNEEPQSEDQEKSLLIVNPCTAVESHFLDLNLSKVRLKLEPEEVIPGVKMDAAKKVLWEATLCFMEDLLRSAYSEAASSFPSSHSQASGVDLNASVPSLNIEVKHIASAMSYGRPEFQLFSQFGLGKVTTSEDSVLDYSRKPFQGKKENL